MEKKRNNFAYIDGANLYMGVSRAEWALDYARFHVWLRKKLGSRKGRACFKRRGLRQHGEVFG